MIIGVYDDVLDLYHPDFRTSANATRVLFLWDQTLTPQAGEAGPPKEPTLPGFTPKGGVTYGVEYDRATIDQELNSFNPPTTPAYGTVRHGGVEKRTARMLRALRLVTVLAKEGSTLVPRQRPISFSSPVPTSFDTGLTR